MVFLPIVSRERLLYLVTLESGLHAMQYYQQLPTEGMQDACGAHLKQLVGRCILLGG